MAQVSDLTDEERAELQRLRAEVSRLRAQNDAPDGGERSMPAAHREAGGAPSLPPCSSSWGACSLRWPW